MILQYNNQYKYFEVSEKADLYLELIKASFNSIKYCVGS